MKSLALLSVFLLLLVPSVLAQEEEEVQVFGLELEKVIMFVTALIATFLFVVSFLAYHRDGRKRFLFVSTAFLLFAIKNFLISSELFIEEIPFIDPIAVGLEFIALLSLFYGVLQK